MTRFKLEDLDHVAITVSELARSIDWYQSVLGMERCYREVWNECPAFMCLGNTGLALFPADGGRAAPAPDSRTHRIVRHIAFRADRENFRQAQETLRQRNIPFQFQDHTISHSIYFRDPDGHQLEITTYDVGTDV